MWKLWMHSVLSPLLFSSYFRKKIAGIIIRPICTNWPFSMQFSTTHTHTQTHDKYEIFVFHNCITAMTHFLMCLIECVLCAIFLNDRVKWFWFIGFMWIKSYSLDWWRRWRRKKNRIKQLNWIIKRFTQEFMIHMKWARFHDHNIMVAVVSQCS